MKNKKRWIIIITIAAATIALCLALYLMLRPTLYHPETLDPRTLHSSSANQEMMEGLWQSEGHIFYRFNADGTGHTWDTDDDISEAEANVFGWKAYDEAIMITHKLKLRGEVPRYYELDRLNAFDLRFHDAYTHYTLERVEEEP